jgi:hypothetical protein
MKLLALGIVTVFTRQSPQSPVARVIALMLATCLHCSHAACSASVANPLHLPAFDESERTLWHWHRRYSRARVRVEVTFGSLAPLTWFNVDCWSHRGDGKSLPNPAILHHNFVSRQAGEIFRLYTRMKNWQQFGDNTWLKHAPQFSRKSGGILHSILDKGNSDSCS